MTFTYHVSKHGSDQSEGTKEHPFLTINKAASKAEAGDTVIVHEGEYREWVKPQHKGLSDKRRITYTAAEDEHVVIKGSERITNWQQVEGAIWSVKIPNAFFGDYNPFEKEVFGDWLAAPEVKHLGDVYLNGMSFYEVTTFDKLKDLKKRTEIIDDWTGKTVPVKNPYQTLYGWYAEVTPKETTIYANFQEANPNTEVVEINVRKACFYPDQTGIDYITVRGFEMAHAATPWTPPTADQPGLIGANWSKGWIIEDNVIHDSKCSAISIGKEISTGHHKRSIRKDKPGYQYQLESVFDASRKGWKKELVGSHVIRRNTIYDCGQNAIVGHLGCVFSEIYDNHIYNIALKREFYGFEIAGIKLHAAIDVQIKRNRIHDCSLGIWLDWQTQGTRLTQNILYQNSRDLFIEVSHGPYTVDHNILASEYAMDNFAQGGAYINNLICGQMKHQDVRDRSTPYHLPHSTEVAGFALVYGGDDRFYQNIFVGKDGLDDVGTSHYDGYTTSLEDYINTVEEVPGDVERYADINQPAYVDHNVYLNGAKGFDREANPFEMGAFDPNVEVTEEEDGVYLSLDLPDGFSQLKSPVHSTDTLTRVRIVDSEFENPDGTKMVLDVDLLNARKDNETLSGPIQVLKEGKNRIKVWSN
ncbi:Protein of unknown function [Pelagirhabdus alkalitolerans]|uniref:Right handed beta helix region n=1 Tax=Pelagirhabdus alkalitolerans TaxID=1612202 RepID=A0A1G6JVY9_9BACI|nr:right-handed parallel beta-helix repeat-containing protein [Pelagirhabdus alkalitolerans]SDC22883.1 Protein of unknown function [Pelagirhabdus alkalitolerans]